VPNWCTSELLSTFVKRLFHTGATYLKIAFYLAMKVIARDAAHRPCVSCDTPRIPLLIQKIDAPAA